MNPERDPTGKPVDADLRALFQSGAPSEPSEADWAMTLESIRRRLERSQVRALPASSGRWRRGALVAAALAAAAAVLVAVTLPWFRPSVAAPTADVRADTAEFPVTDAEDVEILSVDTADAGAIVVGELPRRKPIVWVEPGDVALQGESPSDMHMHSDGDETPMLWAPLPASGPSKQ